MKKKSVCFFCFLCTPLATGWCWVPYNIKENVLPTSYLYQVKTILTSGSCLDWSLRFCGSIFKGNQPLPSFSLAGGWGGGKSDRKSPSWPWALGGTRVQSLPDSVPVPLTTTKPAVQLHKGAEKMFQGLFGNHEIKRKIKKAPKHQQKWKKVKWGGDGQAILIAWLCQTHRNMNCNQITPITRYV